MTTAASDDLRDGGMLVGVWRFLSGLAVILG
jgi:hypothetical protein